MPPPRRSFGCQKHCYIWWYRDNVLMIGCGHCATMYRKVVAPAGTPELLETLAQRSREGHQHACGRPIR